jgi:hypothetical protein
MPQLNVFGEEMSPCSTQPMTGFYRTGCCDTGPEDFGQHTVCAQMTADFLQFSIEKGNDLSTPAPQYGFPGLKPGDRWCLCVDRWIEAYQAGKAPWIYLKATHQSVLKSVSMDILIQFSVEARLN